MNLHKGFSLIEVLISLALVTVLVLAVMQQQWQSRHLLTQLINQIQQGQSADDLKEIARVRLSILAV